MLKLSFIITLIFCIMFAACNEEFNSNMTDPGLLPAQSNLAGGISSENLKVEVAQGDKGFVQVTPVIWDGVSSLDDGRVYVISSAQVEAFSEKSTGIKKILAAIKDRRQTGKQKEQSLAQLATDEHWSSDGSIHVVAGAECHQYFGTGFCISEFEDENNGPAWHYHCIDWMLDYLVVTRTDPQGSYASMQTSLMIDGEDWDEFIWATAEGIHDNDQALADEWCYW